MVKKEADTASQAIEKLSIAFLFVPPSIINYRINM